MALHAGDLGPRLARALLLGSSVASIWMIENDSLNWWACAPSAAFVAGSVPLFVCACVWQLFRSAERGAAPVRVRDRLRAALSGMVIVAVVAALCWRLIPRLAPEPNCYPELYVESQARVLSEAIGVSFLGTIGSLLVPSRLYAAEARDPIRAILAWAAAPLSALVLFWAPLKCTVTHVGHPSGWGRLVILNVAFGVGWLMSAGRATGATPAGEVLVHKASHNVAYVTAVALALVVALFVIGGLLDGDLGLCALCLIVVLTGLLIVQWQAPRSESGVAELGRSLLLSAPILLPLAAVAASLVAGGARLSSSAPSFLLVPLPFAVAGTLWLIGVLAILTVRLGVSASR